MHHLRLSCRHREPLPRQSTCWRVQSVRAGSTFRLVCQPLNKQQPERRQVLGAVRNMSSSDYDEDLKLAIEMSLQQNQPTKSPTATTENVFIDLTSDTENEDEDLRTAIALSMHESKDLTATDKLAEAASRQNEATAASKPQGLAGLDRKAMEQERLARLGKRKRDSSPSQRSKRTLRVPSTTMTEASNSQAKPATSVSIQYPRGAIKRTVAKKYPRTDDITIDELLETSSLNIAVISSFMWDQPWLEQKLDPRTVKQIWVMNVKGLDVQERYVSDLEKSRVPNTKLHFPPMTGIIHSMHSKYMLLFGEKKLRIVVPTANMTRIDWGEVANDWQPACMENTVFLIDLPRIVDGGKEKKDSPTPFRQELIYFLEQQKVGKNVVDGVLKFDFSQTAHIAFVHSV